MDRGSGSTGRWECIDFELEIREGGPRNYPVAVRSPAGEAQEQMRLPFDEGEIEDRLRTLEVALLRSGGRRRRMPSQEERTVHEFGQALFESLLVGDVRTRYEISLDKARQQNKGLRLKLRIQPPELTGLPWEFLYDEGQGEYLCLSSETPLVRYVDLRRPIEQLPVTPPLRILGMVASPLDLEPLDVEDEKRLVEQAIKDLRADGLVELTWLEGQTWRDLQRAMRRGWWHIFHFIGHGDFDPATDEGRIALSDESGRRHLLKATHLARLLDDHRPLRLAFLNSCEGAQGSEGDPFSSTAATLVRRGIPAVVAMQYEISDKAAIEFSRSFYEAVADSMPVDAAVAEARTAVSMVSNLEWGTPVLYMRSPDGRIFDVSTEEPPVKPIPEETRDPEKEERQNRLNELYAQARRSHQDQEWQAVVDLFDQIHALDPEHPDPEGFLASAREELRALEQARRRVAALYDQGLRHMEAGEWTNALECFEEVQRLKPSYRETEKLLEEVRNELAKPPTVEVPDLTGQEASQASSTLENRGLKLGARDEAPSETVPEGSIIRQTPTAGTEVKPGSSVSVTLSSGQEKRPTPTSPYVEPERQDRWKWEEVLSTVTSTLAMFGGIVALVAALIGVFTHLGDLGAFSGPPGVILGEFAGYCLSLVGILGGLVGLHIRQAPTYGRLGRAGFLTALVGTTLILMATFIYLMFLYFYRNELSLLVSQDPPVWLFLLGILGELGVFVGYILLGRATLRARVLPRWCGVGFIIASVSVPLGILGGPLLLLGEVIVIGLLWLALGYVLWYQRGITPDHRS